MKYEIKRNDTFPPITATLQDEQGIIPLTGTTVRFKMAAAPDAGITFTPISRACTITNATGGTVQFSWQAGDTATAGVYRAEFEVTFPNGAIETFPSNDYINIIIRSDLG
jgi:hypothetical protein